MSVLFLDSSALVKRYIAETGSDTVSALLSPQAGNVVFISVISGVEVVAALTRRQRIGDVTQQQAASVISAFVDDWSEVYELIMADRPTIRRAMDLAQRHALRAYDAVQLASALAVHAHLVARNVPLIFLSADVALNDAGSGEGLQIQNPQTDA